MSKRFREKKNKLQLQIIRAAITLIIAVFTGAEICPLLSYADSDEDKMALHKAMTVASNETRNWPQGPEVSAEAAIVMDAGTGMILYEKNIHLKEYPASTTKMLTCLIAAENCEQSEVVSFSYDAVFDTPRNSNHVAIDPGEELTVYECLQAILIRSANECSFALAEHVGGDRETFSKMMNEKAAELGCVESNFVNPNGLPDENHYTSAYDLALIGRAFLENETLRNISVMPRLHIYPSAKQKDEIIENTTNQMVKGKKYEYEYFIGGKTGHTEDAGYCLVSGAEKDGMRLICVVMNDVDSYQYLDTISLFDYGFSNFDKVNISETETRYNISTKGSYYTGVDVFGNSEPILALNKNDYIILPKTVPFSDIESEISYETDSDTEAAIITYSYHGRYLGTASVDFADSNDNVTYKFDEMPASVSAEKEEIVIPKEQRVIFINIVKIARYVLIFGGGGTLLFLLIRAIVRYRKLHPNWRANWRRERRKRKNKVRHVGIHEEAKRHKAEFKAERKRRSTGRRRVTKSMTPKKTRIHRFK
nr:D-alanyl-D-alanine carboxypeptidase [Lachnospiraceae bacterium]